MRYVVCLLPLLFATGCPPSTPDAPPEPEPPVSAAADEAPADEVAAADTPAGDAAEPDAAEQLPELRYYAFDG